MLIRKNENPNATKPKLFFHRFNTDAIKNKLMMLIKQIILTNEDKLDLNIK